MDERELKRRTKAEFIAKPGIVVEEANKLTVIMVASRKSAQK